MQQILQSGSGEEARSKRLGEDAPKHYLSDFDDLMGRWFDVSLWDCEFETTLAQTLKGEGVLHLFSLIK